MVRQRRAGNNSGASPPAGNSKCHQGRLFHPLFGKVYFIFFLIPSPCICMYIYIYTLPTPFWRGFCGIWCPPACTFPSHFCPGKRADFKIFPPLRGAHPIPTKFLKNARRKSVKILLFLGNFLPRGFSGRAAPTCLGPPKRFAEKRGGKSWCQKLSDVHMGPSFSRRSQKLKLNK